MLRIYLLLPVASLVLALAQPASAYQTERTPRPDAPKKDASSDAVFFRRLHFDMFRLPPLPEDLKKFVEDKDPEKGSKAIDRFLASPEYSKHWQQHWSKVIDQQVLESEETRKHWNEHWKKIKK